MKLIIGLGNPGKSYEKTRHNIGFNFIDYYLKYKNISPVWKNKYKGDIFITEVNGEKVIFLKPMTYMNLSGECVRKIVNYYGISIDDIIVICDDLDLSVGYFKFKLSGSNAGHNGIKDIEKNLGTTEFKRIKIGIGNDKLIDTKDYVLGKINSEDKKLIEDVYLECSKGLDSWFENDFSKVMSLFNKKNNS